MFDCKVSISQWSVKQCSFLCKIEWTQNTTKTNKYSLNPNINSDYTHYKWKCWIWFVIFKKTTTDLCIASHVVQILSVSLYLSVSLRCNEDCAAGSYGQDCKGVCDCANGARCYNIDGACLCEPGFSGPHCRDRMCAPRTYGMHCERTCLCQEKHTLRWVEVVRNRGFIFSNISKKHIVWLSIGSSFSMFNVCFHWCKGREWSWLNKLSHLE